MTDPARPTADPASRTALERSPGDRPASPGSPRRPATIYDVATAAGVSHQTVSRYLKGFAGIRPETRARVESALAELDYRPNLTARSLTTGRSHRIGALTHEIDQFGPSKILGAASAAARDAGYVLDIVTLDTSDVGSIREALALITQHDLEGVLALSSTDEMTAAFEQVDFRVPSVIATEPDEPLHGRSQLARVGLPELVDHLAGLGHTTAIHLAGPGRWSAARNRRRLFEGEAARAGIAVRAIIEGDWSARSGYEAIRDLPEIDATAIVAANDQMALGAMLALKERGLDVPGDVSVTGIDDTPDAAYYTPPLTTLRMDFAAQGRAAALELISRVEQAGAPEPPAIESRLIVRESTGPARR